MMKEQGTFATQNRPFSADDASHNMPVGQVFFAPREEITLGGTREELDAIYKSMEEFNREKAKLQQDDPLGTRHSPLYIRRSREQKAPRRPVKRATGRSRDAPRPRTARAGSLTYSALSDAPAAGRPSQEAA